MLPSLQRFLLSEKEFAVKDEKFAVKDEKEFIVKDEKFAVKREKNEETSQFIVANAPSLQSLSITHVNDEYEEVRISSTFYSVS